MIVDEDHPRGPWSTLIIWSKSASVMGPLVLSADHDLGPELALCLELLEDGDAGVPLAAHRRFDVDAGHVRFERCLVVEHDRIADGGDMPGDESGAQAGAGCWSWWWSRLSGRWWRRTWWARWRSWPDCAEDDGGVPAMLRDDHHTNDDGSSCDEDDPERM